MLDEQALRRPEFAGGVPITLADGTAWTFPRPRVELYPIVGPAGIELGARPTFGPEYEAKVEAFYEAIHGDGSEVLVAVFALAIDLLGRNYTLGAEDFGRLLRWETENPALAAMWTSIKDVALGRAPKPSGDGSEPSSSPTGSAAP